MEGKIKGNCTRRSLLAGFGRVYRPSRSLQEDGLTERWGVGMQKLNLLVIVIICLPGRVGAQSVDILLDSNPPPVSQALMDYAEAVRSDQQIIVGFSGGDIGFGPGDGNEEIVPFLFTFPPMLNIQSARLDLDLTPRNTYITTDELMPVDVGDVTHAWSLGNRELSQLAVGVRTMVSFDLQAIGGHRDSSSVYDLRPYLMDGDLGIVFGDDALIHSARLRLSGTASAPETCGANVALNRPSTASAGADRAAMAFDGDYSTAWGAWDWPPHWVEVDLGAGVHICGFRLVVDNSPDAITHHRIWGRTADGAEDLLWSLDQYTVKHKVLDLELPHPTASAYRWVRVETVDSPSWVAWFEIEVLGEPAVPVRSSSWGSIKTRYN